jgi:hypothetical protein
MAVLVLHGVRCIVRGGLFFFLEPTRGVIVGDLILK